MDSGNTERNLFKTLVGQLATILEYATKGTRDLRDMTRFLQILVSELDFVKLLDAPRQAIAQAVEPAVKATKRALLRFVATVAVPGTTESFRVNSWFNMNNSEVGFRYVSEKFKGFFGDMEVAPSDGIELSCQELIRNAYDREIIADLGGKEKCITKLSELRGLLMKQPRGEEGILLTDGRANIFYVYDSAAVLRAVYVNWNDNGWYVNANDLDYNNWNENRRVFSSSAPSV